MSSDVNLVQFLAVCEEKFESLVGEAEIDMLDVGEVEVFDGLFDMLSSFVLALAVDHDVEIEHWFSLRIGCVVFERS